MALGGDGGHATGVLPDVVLETSLLRGRKRASWGTQFRILLPRTFIKFMRFWLRVIFLLLDWLSFVDCSSTMSCKFDDRLSDLRPRCFIGMIFQDSRIGLGFLHARPSCLSSLGLFANERILFMHERFFVFFCT